jgi:hypothetical protein
MKSEGVGESASESAGGAKSFMRTSRLLLFLVPLAFGAAGYWVARSISSPVVAGSPGEMIDVPDRIDLGLRKPGPAEARFSVHNRGDRDAEVTRIRTGCGCMTVHLDGTADSAPLERLTVPRHGFVDLVARVSVRATSDGEFKSTIYLETTDPRLPEAAVHVTAKVDRAVVASPCHWLVGSLFTNAVRTCRVEIHDLGYGNPRSIDRVVSSNPAIVQVVGLDRRNERRPTGGRCIGSVDLRLSPPDVPGEIDLQVSVFESDSAEPIVVIPVTGRLLPRFQVSPAVVLLPRQTSSGPSDSITVLVQSPTRQPFDLTIEDSGGLEVGVPAHSSPKVAHSVKIAWPLDRRPEPGQTKRQTVKFIVSAGGEGQSLQVLVTYRGFDPSPPATR